LAGWLLHFVGWLAVVNFGQGNCWVLVAWGSIAITVQNSRLETLSVCGLGSLYVLGMCLLCSVSETQQLVNAHLGKLVKESLARSCMPTQIAMNQPPKPKHPSLNVLEIGNHPPTNPPTTSIKAINTPASAKPPPSLTRSRLRVLANRSECSLLASQASGYSVWVTSNFILRSGIVGTWLGLHSKCWFLLAERMAGTKRLKATLMTWLACAQQPKSS
jgi:hypothetical protein